MRLNESSKPAPFLEVEIQTDFCKNCRKPTQPGTKTIFTHVPKPEHANIFEFFAICPLCLPTAITIKAFIKSLRVHPIHRN
jgi:hypothetical protein